MTLSGMGVAPSLLFSDTKVNRLQNFARQVPYAS